MTVEFIPKVTRPATKLWATVPPATKKLPLATVILVPLLVVWLRFQPVTHLESTACWQLPLDRNAANTLAATTSADVLNVGRHPQGLLTQTPVLGDRDPEPAGVLGMVLKFR